MMYGKPGATLTGIMPTVRQGIHLTEPPIAPGQEEWEQTFAYLRDCVAYFEAHATVDLPRSRLDILRAEHHMAEWLYLGFVKEGVPASERAVSVNNAGLWQQFVQELKK